MSRLLSTLTLLALLLFAAAPASGVMVRGEKTAVPDFFGSSLESASGDECPATQYRTRGGVDCSYEPALDVRDGPNLYAYCVQNPWSKFDPHGLSEEEIQAINKAVDAKVKSLGFLGRVASWVGADKALKSSLGTANERYNANAAAGKGRTLSTGEYIGGIAEGSAPAATIAMMAPAAAAGPLVLAKEGVAEVTGLPIGVDDLVKVAKNAPDLVSSARKLAQGTDEVVEQVVEEGPPVPGTVYRGGSQTDNNLTPRPQDEGMLSARDSLSNPYPLAPGQKPPLPRDSPIQVIDTSKLPPGSVVPDGVPHGTQQAGHVSIGPDVPASTVREAITETIPRSKTK